MKFILFLTFMSVSTFSFSSSCKQRAQIIYTKHYAIGSMDQKLDNPPRNAGARYLRNLEDLKDRNEDELYRLQRNFEYECLK